MGIMHTLPINLTPSPWQEPCPCWSFVGHMSVLTNKKGQPQRVDLGFLAPRVGFEPTTLRLTEALTWGNVLSELSKPLLKCVRPVVSPLRPLTEYQRFRSFRRALVGHLSVVLSVTMSVKFRLRMAVENREGKEEAMQYTSRGMRRRRNTDKWEITLSHKDPITGEQVRSFHTIEAKTEKQAERKRDELILELERKGSGFWIC